MATPRPTPRTDGRQRPRREPVRSPERAYAPSNWKDSRRNTQSVVIVLAIIAALVLGGVFAWTHRSVTVSVDGTHRSYTIGTTVQQVFDEEKPGVTAGNLVSVNGNLITEGGGDPYSATVDGKAISPSKAKERGIKGGEDIAFSNGADKTEDYDETTVDVAPKLLMDGNAGAVSYISQWGKAGKATVRTGKVSGETAQTVTTPAQDCVVTVKNITPADGRKLVALTFDDGPSDYTERYLQILKEHGAVATFFCLGSKVEASPDLAKEIVDSGCQIASHSYSHPQLTSLDAAGVQSELSTSFADISNATSVQTTAFRPPYGAFNQETWLKTQGLATVSVIWNMDSRDWARPGADAIVSNSCDGIQPGYIILMHDGGGNRDQDLEALPQIIDRLKSEGYTFVTISDLLASDSSIPSEVASCDETMPSDAVWPTEVG
ncbi:MAG: polysaccharide deacetylase family protein [Atopobiaceae bacterium]|jgi:peptidoglycan/xylan/chitin deacetylase (PgdA/CDA1 family)|nr:polysaccharide deacetylase family protein [Atopobiaceae bacterium]MCH4120268.1 polysaccharide deacetylase family protein [Atopobiaceae bacterium]MCI1431846.1 polysaccharide deacetylase family protein [Atopobiaceae bacterium]MCI1470282.1 polysaccharide deacetylase family protein [Atopobiaceae bacterium]